MEITYSTSMWNDDSQLEMKAFGCRSDSSEETPRGATVAARTLHRLVPLNIAGVSNTACTHSPELRPQILQGIIISEQRYR